MVERVWNPHRDEQGLEPLEVRISNGRAYVGYVESSIVGSSKMT